MPDEPPPPVNAPPTTTLGEEKTKAGQRFVNMIWEANQGIISLAVVGTTLFVAALLVLKSNDVAASQEQRIMADKAFQLLISLVSGIIGFYFGRTNHQKTGGVGPNDTGR